MTVSLGLDIGSNSVGSAWVDTVHQVVSLGVGVFPAGVEEETGKRGRPVNQDRREKRHQRLSLARRADRGRRLRKLLAGAGLLPADPRELELLMRSDPLDLRRRALTEPVSPHDFGRILVHLNRRRGATGISLGEDQEPEAAESRDQEPGKAKKKARPGSQKDQEEGVIKEAILRLRQRMKAAGAQTPGQFFADLRDQRRTPIQGRRADSVGEPIRNRQYRMDPQEHLYADREMIRQEFLLLWERQKSFGGKLAPLLTDELKKALDNPAPDATWRHRGVIFEQRRTYWDAGTLGRCDLEPTDRCCPLADRHAQQFRVLETVNNIRLAANNEAPRPLTPSQRDAVVAALRLCRNASVATVRKALGIDKKSVRNFYSLNLENDPDREINTDWFYRQIVHGVFTEATWLAMAEDARESVNRAILKLDPDVPAHEARLRQGAAAWWGLSPDAADRLVEAWKRRPKLEKRVSLSRRAILNILPYLNQADQQGRWLTVPEACVAFAEDGQALDQTTGREPTLAQRARYARVSLSPGAGDGEGRPASPAPLSRDARRFLERHPDLLPPAPNLANPVVRKAVHEVRRHVIEHMRTHGRRPDRIVIELAREAKHSALVRDRALEQNRRREKVRAQIRETYSALLQGQTSRQVRRAEDRVLLCRQQRGRCPYCDQTLSESAAARGDGVEVDHIVPFSRSGDNALSNLVLCHTHCNRGKGRCTPSEWLSPERFAELERRLGHFRNPDRADQDYFGRKDFQRKWDNLHRQVREGDEFRNSQLSDTSYAARQVAEYLEGALYGGEEDRGRRHVFFTKGAYTAILRGDWQLHDKHLGKVRDDHRHHAIDAVVIALTDSARIQDLARHAAAQEEARSRGEGDLKRRPLPPPWGDVAEFRRQVLERIDALVVSHRRVRRRLAGPLHKEEHFGPVLEAPDRASRKLFTKRIQALELTPKHLRLPEGGQELEKRMNDPALSRPEQAAAWRQLRALPDVEPGKTGIVRELSLRLEVRACLRRHNVDPDRFDDDQIRKLLAGPGLRMRSGTPVKSLVLLRTIKNPVIIPRKAPDPATGRLVPHADPAERERALRVYESQNNHHVEIREGPDGRWSGRVVSAFSATCRVRRKCVARSCEGCLGASGLVPAPAGTRQVHPVDRSDHGEKRFVISLSMGETLHMRHPGTGKEGYFVVFKLARPATVHFIHHWDARPSCQTDGQEAREEIAVLASKLKFLGPVEGKPPVKVRVGPLGTITPLAGD